MTNFHQHCRKQRVFMNFDLNREADIPLYRQVSNQIKEYIRTGTLAPGSQLPTIRYLAVANGLTRLTVQTAYAELQSEGLLEGIVGRGTFVATRFAPAPTAKIHLTRPPEPPWTWINQSLLADMLRLSEVPNILSFAEASPDSHTLPLRELRQAMSRVMQSSNVLDYGPVQGEPVLREEVAQLLLGRGIVTSPDNILIVSGGQQGLSLVLQSLSGPDDVMVIEEPSYPGLIELAAQRQQKVVSVPVDAEGLCVDQLEEICKLYAPKLVCTNPTFHNPTGLSHSPARRARLLELARQYDFTIMEDDVYGFLSFDQVAPLALKAADDALGRSGRVVYVTSFSKTLAPGLRMGAIVADWERLNIIMNTKRTTDLVCSSLIQHGLAEFLRRHRGGSHFQMLRQLYCERRDATLQALERYMPQCQWRKPDGGLCVWVKLPPGINEREFYLAAIERGVGFAPGQAFFAQLQAQPYMRLAYGNRTPVQMAQGIAILGQLLREQQARQRNLTARASRINSMLV